MGIKKVGRGIRKRLLAMDEPPVERNRSDFKYVQLATLSGRGG